MTYAIQHGPLLHRLAVAALFALGIQIRRVDKDKRSSALFAHGGDATCSASIAPVSCGLGLYRHGRSILLIRHIAAAGAR